jgi:hypothetical protein
MGMLGNSNRGLLPMQKHLLYRTCVLPIATYGYRLWYHNKAKVKGLMSSLSRMQRQAALWIISAFRTSPTGGCEAIAGLIPIHLFFLFYFFYQVYLTWCSNAVHAHTKYIVQVKIIKRRENSTWLQSRVRVRLAAWYWCHLWEDWQRKNFGGERRGDSWDMSPCLPHRLISKCRMAQAIEKT